MLDTHRNWFKNLELQTAKIFKKLPLSPNQYTLLSVAAALVMAYFVISGGYIWALVFFAAAAILDFIDGAIARAKNLATAKGAYWDTIADRYVEAIVLFGLLFVNLPDFYLPSCAWIFLALFGSMMTTYAKAAAGEKKLTATEVKGGLMSRAERLIAYGAILILLILGLKEWVIVMLAILGVLTNLTAIQRINKALTN